MFHMLIYFIHTVTLLCFMYNVVLQCLGTILRGALFPNINSYLSFLLIFHEQMAIDKVRFINIIDINTSYTVLYHAF